MSEKLNAYYDYFRRQHTRPYFNFDTPMSHSARLAYEPLRLENYKRLFDLFETDDNLYVDERFKYEGAARDYVSDLDNFARYSPKYGGQDWLFRLQGGAYAGVLHVYDLNIDTTEDRHLKATLGFSTAREFRRQGYTLEAFLHLSEHVAVHLGKPLQRAFTRTTNLPATGLLKKAGFVFVKGDSDWAYFEKKVSGIFPDL